MATAKYGGCIPDMLNYMYLPMNFHVLLDLSTEILYSVYCIIMHLSFLMSHNPLFLILCKKPKKQHFDLFICFAQEKYKL